MAETTFRIEQDLNEAQAMANGLVPYIYEDNLYGSVGGGLFSFGSSMPSLTLGALLMRQQRLHALDAQLSAAQRATLAAIDEKLDSVRQEWTVHWQNKLIQEAHSRLKAMRQFFEECRDNPRTCANSYLPEALRRTIVQVLADEIESENIPSNELDDAMRGTDGMLRRYVRPSEFIWAKELEPVYTPPKYWWLYSKPPQPDR